MTIAMTIATTIRTAHSTKARFELRLGARAGAPSPDAAPAFPSPGPEPSRPPDPLPDGGGAAPVGVSTTVGASTSSVTEVAPPPHPRRSTAPERTRAARKFLGILVPVAEAGRGVGAE